VRVDVQATRKAWRQTLWGTAIATIMLVALCIYFATLPVPDYAAVRFLLLLLLLMPVMIGVAYLVRRFIESLAS
jgi:cadmium resistance protein CadD (predicted permease)